MSIKFYETKLESDGTVIAKVKGLVEGDILEILTTDEAVKLAQDVLKLHEYPDEYVFMFCLKSTCELIGVFEVSHGSISTTTVAMRDIIQKALLVNAAGFVLVHNHPSGRAHPSEVDKEFTKKVLKASKLMDIIFADHLIVAYEGYYSFRENKKLKG